MSNEKLRILKNTIEQMACDADDKGLADFGLRLSVADAFAICKLEPPSRWIPCSDRPPEEKGCYLVAAKHWFDGKPVTREAFWNGADWLSCEKKVEITPRVTHWQPLPEPPEEAQGNE